MPDGNKHDGLSRRSALAMVLGGMTALLGSALALAGGFLANAFRRRGERPWLRLGPAEELNPDTFEKRVLTLEERHAWQRELRPLVVYVKDTFDPDTNPDGLPVVLSSRCTHLGCTVGWDKQAGRFRCPCHGGEYAPDGSVLKGPPERPLAHLEVKIEDEVCWVRPGAAT